MNKVKRNYILNTSFQVLRLIVPLVVTPYISRVLGAEGVGTFSYTYSIQYYFSLFAALGVSAYGGREIARCQGQPRQYSLLFWEIKLLSLVTALVSMLAWGLFVWQVQEYRLYYWILSMYLLASALDISWFYIGLERFPEITIRNIVIRLLEVALVLLLVKKAEDLYIYFFIMAGGTLVGNLALWPGMRKLLVRVPWSELRIFRHFKNTLIYFLPTIATSIYTVLDKSLIGLITKDVAENGYYEQATKVIDILKAVVFVSLNAVLGPRCTNLYAKGKVEEIKGILRGSVDFMLLLGIGAVFGLIGVANLFVPWFFGDGFDRVGILLKCLAPIIVVITISNSLGYQYYDPAGQRLKSAKFLMIGAGCNLMLNCLLIPRLQSVGAVIGSVLSEVVISALYLKNCEGYLRFGQILAMGWKKVVAGGLMLVVLLYRSAGCQPVTVDILLLVLQGVLVYFAVLFLLQDSLLIQTTKKYYLLFRDRQRKKQKGERP